MTLRYRVYTAVCAGHTTLDAVAMALPDAARQSVTNALIKLMSLGYLTRPGASGGRKRAYALGERKMAPLGTPHDAGPKRASEREPLDGVARGKIALEEVWPMRGQA